MKNKVAAPFKVCFLDILFGTGIDSVGCLVDAAAELEILKRRGSWYSYEDVNFAQGRTNACSYLKEHKEMMEEVELKVREALVDEKKEVKGVIAAYDEEEEEDKEDAAARTPSILERIIEGDGDV